MFWAVGYEAATLTDLQAAMGGIRPPSFYAAFGSKEDLFREAVELYSSTLGLPMMEGLAREPDVRTAVDHLLRAAVEAFCKPGKPRGCMLVVTAMNTMPSNRGIQEHLRVLRMRRKKVIRERLDRGVADGQLPATVDTLALASFLTTVIDGLAIQARDGASRKLLRFAVECAMAAWDKMVGSRGGEA